MGSHSKGPRMALHTILLLTVGQILILPCLGTLRVSPDCIDSTYLPDSSNCHAFWHCHQGYTEAKSCGFMMFNPVKQVCDWPSKVLQLRPECRQEAQQLDPSMTSPWQRERTQRMLRYLQPRRQSYEAVPKDDTEEELAGEPYSLLEVTEIISNKVREQISQRIPKELEHVGENKVIDAVPVHHDRRTALKIRKNKNKKKACLAGCGPSLETVRKLVLRNRNQLKQRRLHLAERKKQQQKLLKKNSVERSNVQDKDEDEEKLKPDSNKLLLLKSVVQQAANNVDDERATYGP